MSDAEARRTLAALLLDADGLAERDLRGRLQWLEDAALAAEQLDLGPDAARGALDLKAALGAVVQFASSSMNDEAVLQLEVVFRALVARGTSTLCRAVAEQYRAIAKERAAPKRAEAAEMAAVFDEIADATENGRAVAPKTAARLDAVRRSLG